MLIYYCILIIANVASIFIFNQSVNITGLSILPLLLIVLMSFQAYMFKNTKIENGFRTAYGSKLTEDEENSMFNSGSIFLVVMIPWMIPFVIFFSSTIKMFSILVYFIGLIGGLVAYRLKNTNKIVKRMDTEEKERQAQEKREELGKWK